MGSLVKEGMDANMRLFLFRPRTVFVLPRHEIFTYGRYERTCINAMIDRDRPYSKQHYYWH